MKLRIAIAIASALMLIAAPSALADESRSPDGGDRTPVENGYPPLPPECHPTEDRTAIECTYFFDDRVDVQPAYGCWTLADGSELCVDPPFVGCNYAAGECDVVVDPAADRCVIAFGPEIDRTIYLVRDGGLYIIEWDWGSDPAADAAIRQSWSELFQLIAAGDYTEYFARCSPSTEYRPEDPGAIPPPNEDGSFDCPDGAELCIPPMPDDVIADESGARFSSPVALSGARAEKGKKGGKAKKKARGKKSKQKKSRR